MAISYELAPIPKWYIADLTGRPLGAGTMYTYRSLDKTTQKFIYQDPAGSFPWPDPVLFDENGSQGPFYWEVNSLDPDETYYIEVYDANGVLQWTIDDFSPPGGGGGSVVTIATDLENLIANNVMWRATIGTTPVSSTVLTKIAPGAHAGFSNNALNANGLYTGSDIYFIKNNTNAIDTISFPKFVLGVTPFTGDVTPVNYMNYTCANTPAAETIKCVQFPITTAVQNLSNQDVTITLWARCNSGNTSLTLQWFQFFGDGVGASAPLTTSIQTLTLTAAWQKFVVQDTVPDVTGKTLGSMGACGNDALFLQVAYPLGVVTNIDFQKPCVYLGSISPSEDYHTYDMIDGLINSIRTGYVYSAYDTEAIPGFVIMDDGSIGSAASAATTRANSDTFPLYNLLYNRVSDSWAPVSGGRSGDAVADFIANKTLTLPRVLGRVLGSSGTGAGLTARDLGEYLGEEDYLLVTADMPPIDLAIYTVGGTRTKIAAGDAASFVTNTTADTDPPHTQTAVSLMQPTAFTNYFIKL